MEKDSEQPERSLETLHRESVWDANGTPFELVWLRDDTGQLWLMRSIGHDVWRWDPAAIVDEVDYDDD